VTSSGLGTVVNQPGAGVFEITGGTRPDGGSNLFHSFGNFSLDAGQSGNFINDSGLATTNIFSRVTGGNPSNIFGTIDSSSFAGANLYLMNPAGILFGPTAQLNVGGSFHATTADYIKLGNQGGIFYADPARASTLSVAAPSAFGFLAANPAAIDVNTSNFLIGTPGTTMSFVGGPVSIGASDGTAPGYVFVPGGRVNLTSVASPGEASFDGTGFNVDSFAELGAINIWGDSIVDGKEVYVRSGQLTIDNGIILPNLTFFFGAPPVDGGEVNIEVTGDVTITGTHPDPLSDTSPGIFVYSGDFYDVPVAGTLPEVNIQAQSLSVSGFSSITSNRAGPGAPADIVINADTVTVSNGGSIVAFNTWEGDGGNLIVNAKDVDLSGGDADATPTGFRGLAAQGLFHPIFADLSVDPALTHANSGNITLNLSGDLSVHGVAEIATDSLSLGNAGNITVHAHNVQLLGTGTGEAAAGLIGSQSVFAGDSGDITIDASGAINIQGGFRISSSTGASGKAGDISLTAAGPITLSDTNSRLLSRTSQPPDSTLDDMFSLTLGVDYAFLKDLTTNVLGITDPSMFDVLLTLRELGILDLTDEQLLAGDAGTISINTGMLTMNAGTSIETSTGWDGNAGGVKVNVGSLSLNDGASIRSTSGFELLERDGTIVGPVVGSGNGGSLDLAASDTISISGRSPTTGVGSSVSTSTFGDGDGGGITISGNHVEISNGGIVSADSGGILAGESLSGTGLAGDITINAGREINLSDGTISTRAVTSDGGNITMTAPDQIYLLDSEITTSVESGLGGGGNINIDPQFMILNNSNILANAYGGPGGNINLVAENFIISANSRIDASSALGVDGTVNLSSPDEDVAKDLAVLPSSYQDVTGIISDRCTAATAGASSLVAAGPGGLAVDPDGYLPSFAAATVQEDEGKGRSSSVSDGGGNRWWAEESAKSVLQLAQVTCTR